MPLPPPPVAAQACVVHDYEASKVDKASLEIVQIRGVGFRMKFETAGDEPIRAISMVSARGNQMLFVNNQTIRLSLGRVYTWIANDWVVMAKELAPYSVEWKSIHDKAVELAKSANPKRLPPGAVLAFSLGYQFRPDKSLGGSFDMMSAFGGLEINEKDRVDEIPMRFDVGTLGVEGGERVEVEWRRQPYVVKTVKWHYETKDVKRVRTLECPEPVTRTDQGLVEGIEELDEYIAKTPEPEDEVPFRAPLAAAAGGVFINSKRKDGARAEYVCGHAALDLKQKVKADGCIAGDDPLVAALNGSDVPKMCKDALDGIVKGVKACKKT